jgi:hypothetical protein
MDNNENKDQKENILSALKSLLNGLSLKKDAEDINVNKKIEQDLSLLNFSKLNRADQINIVKRDIYK